MSFARSLAILILLGLVGFIGYQIGITQTIGVAAPSAAAPVVYYGYPFHWGFGGLFSLLFSLFFLFLFFGLIRAAFWGGRGWGGRGHGYKYGGPWASDEARSRIEELHKELHGEKPASSGPSSTST